MLNTKIVNAIIWYSAPWIELKYIIICGWRNLNTFVCTRTVNIALGLTRNDSTVMVSRSNRAFAVLNPIFTLTFARKWIRAMQGNLATSDPVCCFTTQGHQILPSTFLCTVYLAKIPIRKNLVNHLIKLFELKRFIPLQNSC